MEQAERRRSHRVVLRDPVECALPLRARVKVLELSLTGALVATNVPLPPGVRGQLRFAVAGSACAAVVTVQRCAGSAESIEIGAMFASMDEASRRHLETFLRTPGK